MDVLRPVPYLAGLLDRMVIKAIRAQVLEKSFQIMEGRVLYRAINGERSYL